MLIGDCGGGWLRQRVRVRATAKRSGGQDSALVTLLKLELPTHQADGKGNEQQEQNVVYFCIVCTHPSCRPRVSCVPF
jgi:hypothetical protein